MLALTVSETLCSLIDISMYILVEPSLTVTYDKSCVGHYSVHYTLFCREGAESADITNQGQCSWLPKDVDRYETWSCL